MNHSIFFSFIIPFYKGEKYIDRLIKSIYNSYNLVSNEIEIEIIIVIDSIDSKIDDLREIIDSFISKEFLAKINFYKNDGNIGVARSRNVGLINSKGKFIVFMDQDDQIDINYFQEVCKRINNFSYDVILINGNYVDSTNRQTPIFYLTPRLHIKNLIKRNFIHTPGLLIFKRVSIQDDNFFEDFSPNFKGTDDLAAYIKFFCNKDVSFTYIPQKIFYYNFHSSNYSKNLNEAINSNLSLLYHYKLLLASLTMQIQRKINSLEFHLGYINSKTKMKFLICNFNFFLSFCAISLLDMNRLISYFHRKLIGFKI